jgi:DNA-binding NarL/FixJ family response regulator
MQGESSSIFSVRTTDHQDEQAQVDAELGSTRLSPREQSVLRLISCGLSNKHIARELCIAPETVKSHAKNILAKFDARTRAEAVACAARCRLI